MCFSGSSLTPGDDIRRVLSGTGKKQTYGLLPVNGPAHFMQVLHSHVPSAWSLTDLLWSLGANCSFLWILKPNSIFSPPEAKSQSLLPWRLQRNTHVCLHGAAIWKQLPPVRAQQRAAAWGYCPLLPSPNALHLRPFARFFTAFNKGGTGQHRPLQHTKYMLGFIEVNLQ